MDRMKLMVSSKIDWIIQKVNKTDQMDWMKLRIYLKKID